MRAFPGFDFSRELLPFGEIDGRAAPEMLPPAAVGQLDGDFNGHGDTIPNVRGGPGARFNGGGEFVLNVTVNPIQLE